MRPKSLYARTALQLEPTDAARRTTQVRNGLNCTHQFAHELMRYSAAEHDAFAREFNRDGLVVLSSHFPRDKLVRWRSAFQPLFEAQVRTAKDDPNRGAQRF